MTEPIDITEAIFDIVAMGEPMYEFNQRVGRPGWHGGFGGDTSNTAIAAARLGGKVAYFTGIGDDSFGRAFRDLWSAEGVDHTFVKTDPSAHTGVYFVTHGPEGHSFSYLRTGSAASRITPSDVPAKLICNSRALHLSAISQAISTSACDAVFKAVEIAKAAKVTVSYDTNLRLQLWPLSRARAIIEATAELSDVLLPGLDDARLLTGLADPDAIVDHYLSRGVKIVALTMGKDGALVATSNVRERIASIRAEAVDATGAGDAFDGGFLIELLKTGDPCKSARFANVAAGLSTEGYGAIEPLPSRAMVMSRLN